MKTIHKQIVGYDWKGRSIWGYAEYRAFENESGKIQVTYRINDQATDHFVGCADTMDDARRMIAESHIGGIMDYLIYLSKRDGTYTKHEWSKEGDRTISEDGRWVITRIDECNFTLYEDGRDVWSGGTLDTERQAINMADRFTNVERIYDERMGEWLKRKGK